MKDFRKRQPRAFLNKPWQVADKPGQFRFTRPLSLTTAQQKMFYLAKIVKFGYLPVNGLGRPTTKYHPLKGMLRDGLLTLHRGHSNGHVSSKFVKLTDVGHAYWMRRAIREQNAAMKFHQDRDWY